jgi:hypothetical protein
LISVKQKSVEDMSFKDKVMTIPQPLGPSPA